MEGDPSNSTGKPLDPLLGVLGALGGLDTFIPGYSIITGVLENFLGLDISRIVPILGILFALSKLWDYLFYQIKDQILQYCTCSVTVTTEIDAYYNVARFLTIKKNLGSKASTLLAISNRRPDGTFVDPEMEQQENEYGGRLKGRPRKSQEYEPMLQSYQYFFYNRRLFIWYRERSGQSSSEFQSSHTLQGKIFCFSSTTQPIKDLIEDAAAFCEAKSTGLTKICRPASAKQRSYGNIYWQSVTERPSRPMSTVIMSREKKDALLADIEQYLLRATRKWYSQRGIPYRRGYLFFGSPGTGKTSLSFALAGLLDLEIYCVSLAEKSMTEEDLFELFSQLPTSCLVLLEDIDTAGLQKRNDLVIKEEDTDSNGLKKSSNEGDNRVSLSGLLNVIDGVASQVGRVLIMTTNDINALDQALLRPGRIDVKVHFPKSTKTDAYDLFVQTFMEYDGDTIDDKQEIPDTLKQLGERFSEQIPDNRYTPAEIQGYLLTWKNSQPVVAVDNVAAWVNGSPAGKESISYDMMKEK